ncbi:MuF-like minor capsid protein [Nocardia phage NC1]|nr:MuF-like minor capsid protein [Nocardia phage NC1]QSL67748.1 MuF-like minor capsid protein [Nocardia phage P69]
MTTPGALPPSRSIYAAPAIAPAEMTEEQSTAFQLAQVAAVVAAAGAARQTLANQTTLLLVPMLRTINPYNVAEVVAFALKAAELVELARQESARISWASIGAQLLAHGFQPTATYEPVGPGRATELNIAYERVAGEYRRRMAAGVESISTLIAQAEEEKFQELGGAVVAKGRTGESNAKIEGTSRSPGTSGSSKGKAGSGSDGGSSSASGSQERTTPSPVDSAKADRAVNQTADDRDAADAEAERAREAAEREADDAFDAEQELRRQARLNEEEKQDLLQRMAQHEMEIRTERMVNDDIAMAARQASQDAMKAAPRGSITAYRRVLHPELSTTGSCGLCVAAADRVYKVGELLPIHNLCKCEVVPIYGNRDPGSQINDEDLAVLYAEAGDTTGGRELKEQRYVVFNHPELGPVLRNKRHSTKDIPFSPRESSASHQAKTKAEARAFQERRAESFGR